jgi:hypothetical protein
MFIPSLKESCNAGVVDQHSDGSIANQHIEANQHI